MQKLLCVVQLPPEVTLAQYVMCHWPLWEQAEEKQLWNSVNPAALSQCCDNYMKMTDLRDQPGVIGHGNDLNFHSIGPHLPCILVSSDTVRLGVIIYTLLLNTECCPSLEQTLLRRFLVYRILRWYPWLMKPSTDCSIRVISECIRKEWNKPQASKRIFSQGYTNIPTAIL